MGARRKRASFSQAMSRAERLRQLRRRRNSDRPPPSASLTNSLTPATGLGLLLALPPRQASPSVGQRVARSLPERWPAVLSRGNAHSQRFKAIDSRTEEGAALVAAPSNWGNGRQDARPCSAHCPVALLRRRRLDFGLPNFGFGLFCVRSSRSRHSLGGALIC